jgi:hypothetical protein
MDNAELHHVEINAVCEQPLSVLCSGPRKCDYTCACAFREGGIQTYAAAAFGKVMADQMYWTVPEPADPARPFCLRLQCALRLMRHTDYRCFCEVPGAAAPPLSSARLHPPRDLLSASNQSVLTSAQHRSAVMHLLSGSEPSASNNNSQEAVEVDSGLHLERRPQCKQRLEV